MKRFAKAWVVPLLLAVTVLSLLAAIVAAVLDLAWGGGFLSWWASVLTAGLAIDFITARTPPAQR